MTTLPVDDAAIAEAKQLRDAFQRFLREYEFGMREVETKISILRDEFTHMHAYNPIEHVKSRVKTPDSIVEKIARKGIEPDFEVIRREITDIAGVRVTCSFVSDVYRLFDLLTQQDDVTVRTVKDYIATPKLNGYRSLHAIIDVPVFLSTGPVAIPVEVQFRTIAMDFWASLEHKIHYKFAGRVPAHLVQSLTDAAEAAGELDVRMERLHREAHESNQRAIQV
ncbi:GTP pyrophosphokinase family protein [Microbacterium sp.]|jgi:putative GTP pyrophosphokinase|uniref:GTP pyrophosphokinase n=1 Tax=unclassified Microbacterium TaxID=2609290 RepID=UPI000C06B88A|nr:GTP pyrophosphokinase family protein [Microbacterium sp.]PYD02253.1 GTP pyrophosphokinase family protein [Microbacterium esteraromaticum]